jgi:CheY-like chemotaxis protein
MELSLQPQTILLGEDEENDVILIRRALERARLANPVHAVSDGEEVLAYLRGEREFADRAKYPFPALLLLDLKLPRKSGFEVIEAVRADPKWKRLLIVVLSSSTLNPDIDRAYELGANSYLVKPPDFENLISMMKQLQSYWMILNAQPT